MSEIYGKYDCLVPTLVRVHMIKKPVLELNYVGQQGIKELVIGLSKSTSGLSWISIDQPSRNIFLKTIWQCGKFTDWFLEHFKE